MNRFILTGVFFLGCDACNWSPTDIAYESLRDSIPRQHNRRLICVIDGPRGWNPRHVINSENTQKSTSNYRLTCPDSGGWSISYRIASFVLIPICI